MNNWVTRHMYSVMWYAMYRHMNKIILWIAGIVSLVILSPAADARLIAPWTMESISETADLIAVGEVLDVAPVITIVATRHDVHWSIPLRCMTAKIRILRFFSKRNELLVEKDQTIAFEYKTIDWTRGPLEIFQIFDTLSVNVVEYPNFHVGDVFAFPLRRTKSFNRQKWELIDEEDFGLLIPCVKQELKELQSETGTAFLQSELADVFSKGSYAEIVKAAKYLSNFYGDEAEIMNSVYQMIADSVGGDETRWLDIAVASYCSMPVQRPTISELLTTQDYTRAEAFLTAKALTHIRSNGLEDRFIRTAISHSPFHSWGTAVTIALNYSHHPTAVRLLNKCLRDNIPDAVFMVSLIIKSKNNPLAPEAVAAAKRLLTESRNLGSLAHILDRVLPFLPMPKYRTLLAQFLSSVPRRYRILLDGFLSQNNLREACRLILEYGSQSDLAFLIKEIRQSQETNQKRYSMLWQSCADSNNKRLIAICRIVINDNNIFHGDTRFCDSAVSVLQRITGVDFGWDYKQSTVEHNKAVEKAKEWLLHDDGNPVILVVPEKDRKQ